MLHLVGEVASCSAILLDACNGPDSNSALWKKASMLSRIIVAFYLFWHGKLGLPGAGWLIRKLQRVVPGLESYSFALRDLGTVTLDFRDETSFEILDLH